LSLTFVDLALDNVRDLLKHALKERVKSQSIIALEFSDKVFNKRVGNGVGSSG
jgi:hypothetical protein